MSAPASHPAVRLTALLCLLTLALAAPAVAAPAQLAKVPGRILDATPERILYLDGPKSLKVRDVATGQDASSRSPAVGTSSRSSRRS